MDGRAHPVAQMKTHYVRARTHDDFWEQWEALLAASTNPLRRGVLFNPGEPPANSIRMFATPTRNSTIVTKITTQDRDSVLVPMLFEIIDSESLHASYDGYQNSILAGRPTAIREFLANKAYREAYSTS